MKPLFPLPPPDAHALRDAVRAMDLTASTRFETELHDARQDAVKTNSTVPLGIFLHRWAVFVALRRHPARARRLQELEHAIGEAVGIEEA
ncbi:hypothetical protein AB4Z54_36265, partial [Streptomyces sp. MCAF7]